jgi:hypothetical protein
MIARAKPIAALAALALAGASSGVAQAGGMYPHVNVTAPNGVVRLGNDFVVIAHGHAANAGLTVYTTERGCEQTNGEERAQMRNHADVRLILDKSPEGSFSFHVKLRASKHGRFFACAFLTQRRTFHTLSHAEATWDVR